jgi:hypothetical protein
VQIRQAPDLAGREAEMAAEGAHEGGVAGELVVQRHVHHADPSVRRRCQPLERLMQPLILNVAILSLIERSKRAQGSQYASHDIRRHTRIPARSAVSPPPAMDE